MRTKLLRKLRNQACNNLRFIGRWSGFWETEINGRRYTSKLVSGFKFLIGDSNDFIIDCIISECAKLRGNVKNKRVMNMIF